MENPKFTIDQMFYLLGSLYVDYKLSIINEQQGQISFKELENKYTAQLGIITSLTKEKEDLQRRYDLQTQRIASMLKGQESKVIHISQQENKDGIPTKGDDNI